MALTLIAPSLLLLALLVGWPILYSLYLSFHELVITGGEISYDFVELSHYLRFFQDPRLHRTILQTIVYTFFEVSGVLIVGMALALILNLRIGGVEVLKRLFLVPWAISFVVNALIWGWIYHGSYGVLNAILLELGFISEYQQWLGSQNTAMAAIIFADLWKAVPFAALVLLAALKGLSKDLDDAAKVDGAGNWARFWHVKLPGIRRVILVLLVLETTWALKAFDVIWVLTRGGPVDRTMVLNVFTYQQTFHFFNFGYGSAVGFLILGINVGLTLFYLKMLRGFDE